MPEQYEAMRDKFAKTMGYDAAQTKAAKIYNAMRKSHPSMEKLSNKPEGAAKKKVRLRVKKKPKQ